MSKLCLKMLCGEPASAVVPAILTVIVTFFWNGLFFLGRVLDNYAVRRTELKKAKAGGRFDQSAASPLPGALLCSSFFFF